MRRLLLCLLVGCDDSAGSGASIGDFGVTDFGQPSDMTVDSGDACPAGTLPQGGGCTPLPLDPCPLVDDRLGPGTDLDGDCFPAPAAEALLEDCDDRRPEAFPGAEERCNGLDDDCDRVVDEGFGLGLGCAGCGGAGKWECAVGDDRRAACSTTPGQSAGGAAVAEVCNDADEDCDGQVDEACRFDLPPAERTSPAICGESLVFLEEGRVVRLAPGGPPQTLHPGPAVWPACDGDQVAWVVPGEAGCLQDPVGHCPGAELWTLDGVVQSGSLGPPVVGEGAVYGHLVGPEGVVLARFSLEGGVEILFENAPLADPSPPVGGRIAARDLAGPTAQVVVRAAEGAAVRLHHAGAATGAPALAPPWVVWRGGSPAALLAATLDRPREPLQITTAGVDQAWLSGERVFWRTPAGLDWMDLATGATGRVAEVPPEAEVAIAHGAVVWVHAGEIFRTRTR